MVTLEGGDTCIPVTFAYHDDSSSDYARYVTLLITNFEFFLVRSSGFNRHQTVFCLPMVWAQIVKSQLKQTATTIWVFLRSFDTT